MKKLSMIALTVIFALSLGLQVMAAGDIDTSTAARNNVNMNTDDAGTGLDGNRSNMMDRNGIGNDRMGTDRMGVTDTTDKNRITGFNDTGYRTNAAEGANDWSWLGLLGLVGLAGLFGRNRAEER